jgi:hypothetical protein
MPIRTPIITAAIALAFATPMAANAAHGNKSVETKSSSRTTLTTPSSSYIHTSTSPNTFINVNACQLTGLCAPAVYPDDVAT